MTVQDAVGAMGLHDLSPAALYLEPGKQDRCKYRVNAAVRESVAFSVCQRALLSSSFFGRTAAAEMRSDQSHASARSAPSAGRPWIPANGLLASFRACNRLTGSDPIEEASGGPWHYIRLREKLSRRRRQPQCASLLIGVTLPPQRHQGTRESRVRADRKATLPLPTRTPGRSATAASFGTQCSRGNTWISGSISNYHDSVWAGLRDL